MEVKAVPELAHNTQYIYMHLYTGTVLHSLYDRDNNAIKKFKEAKKNNVDGKKLLLFIYLHA